MRGVLGSGLQHLQVAPGRTCVLEGEAMTLSPPGVDVGYGATSVAAPGHKLATGGRVVGTSAYTRSRQAGRTFQTGTVIYFLRRGRRTTGMRSGSSSTIFFFVSPTRPSLPEPPRY